MKAKKTTGKSTASRKRVATIDFSSMSDDEILEAITETFEEDGRLNLGYLDIEVVSASLTISGRVSSDEELQIIEELLEQVGYTNYKNDAWVDEALGMSEAEDDEDNNYKGLNFEEDGDDIEEDYSNDDDDEYNG